MKEVDNKQKELEIDLLVKEAKIMMTLLTDDMNPTHQTWLEKNKKIILARMCDLCIMLLKLCAS
jgi:hypothetical protein